MLLEDFPMVLEGHVAIWWKGIKQTIENWDGAVSSLCDVYSSKYSRMNNGTINRTDRKSTPINIDNQLRYITKEIECFFFSAKLLKEKAKLVPKRDGPYTMAMEIETNEFIPRDYQSEILEIAVQENTIVYLPTGSGIDKVNLMIFDECHQAVENQPMRQIMKLFENVPVDKQPRVVGLTATLLNRNCSPLTVQKVVRSLEMTFQSKVATVQDMAQIIGYSTNPEERITYFQSMVPDKVLQEAINMVTDIVDFASSVKWTSQKHSQTKIKQLTKLLRTLVVHMEMLEIFGAWKSTFVCIVSTERMKRHVKLHKNSLTNDYLVGQTNKRQAPTMREIEEDLYNDRDVEPYYVNGNGSAHVTATAAIQLLNRYCQSLHRDRYSMLTPKWHVKKVDDKYSVVIEMPIVCPLREPIEGLPMTTKVAAKRVAALEVCKRLHQIGELNNNLLPITENENLDNYDCLFTNRTAVDDKPAITSAVKQTEENGDEKLKEPRKSEIPKYLVRQPTTEVGKYYLHLIKMTPNFPASTSSTSNLSAELSILSDELGYGLITLNKLPSVCEFPIFVSSGEISIELYTNVAKLYLLHEDILVLRKFNHFIWNDVLKIMKSFLVYDNVDETGMMLLIPVAISECGSVTIEMKLARQHTRIQQINEPTLQEKLDLVVTEESHKCKIVWPWYRTRKMSKPSRIDSTVFYREASRFTAANTEKRDMMGKTEEHLVPELVHTARLPRTIVVQSITATNNIASGMGVEKLDLEVFHQTTPMPIDERILKTDKQKIQPLQQRNVTETLSSISAKSLTNKNDSAKKLNEQYPWTDEEEPLDIERNLDELTLAEIESFEKFVNMTYEDLKKNKSKFNPADSKSSALTLDAKYEARPILMLREVDNEFGPPQWVIFQCLMAAKATDILNLERLETLGDSFLKLNRIIANRNLLYCGQRKNLGGYMKVSEFLPRTEWLPPGMRVPQILQHKIETNQVSVDKLFEFTIPQKEQISGQITKDTLDDIADVVQQIAKESSEEPDNASSMNLLLGYQNVSDKTVSDCVEALIGAYLHSNGPKGALALMGWLGVIPLSENPTELFTQQPPSPLFNLTITEEQINNHIPNYAKLEEHLGYQFINRAYLLQALTHASDTTNHLTDCYQRLEFLGDAILDFLITCHIYEMSDTLTPMQGRIVEGLTPGQLTDLRSALVNNATFAGLAVRNGFHTHLKYNNTQLMHVIDTFVKFQEERDFEINEEVLILSKDEPYMGEHVNIPKTLGDLFESLAGAVFLDTGMDLQATWSVFYKLMWREIEMFRRNVPISPVRMLYENVKASPKFG
ncbi:Dicer-2 [Carabus blaptoides fortunei]